MEASQAWLGHLSDLLLLLQGEPVHLHVPKTFYSKEKLRYSPPPKKKKKQAEKGYTMCLNKKETRTNMPVSQKVDKHLHNFGYYLLEDYALFPTAPRNVGSIMSVNEHNHLKRG